MVVLYVIAAIVLGLAVIAAVSLAIYCVSQGYSGFSGYFEMANDNYHAWLGCTT